MINLGHGSSQIEILIWDVRNRNFDLRYPRLDLGHGHVWTTTVSKTPKCLDRKKNDIISSSSNGSGIVHLVLVSMK